jgi:hypothetical protein
MNGLQFCRATYNAHTVHSVEVTALLGFTNNEFVKALTTTLLHALEAELDVNGERKILLVMVL